MRRMSLPGNKSDRDSDQPLVAPWRLPAVYAFNAGMGAAAFAFLVATVYPTHWMDLPHDLGVRDVGDLGTVRSWTRREAQEPHARGHANPDKGRDHASARQRPSALLCAHRGRSHRAPRQVRDPHRAHLLTD